MKSEALSLWSKVSGVFTTILNEIPDDEIAILHGAQTQFIADLAAGKPWGEAAADVWTLYQQLTNYPPRSNCNSAGFHQ